MVSWDPLCQSQNKAYAENSLLHSFYWIINVENAFWVKLSYILQWKSVLIKKLYKSAYNLHKSSLQVKSLQIHFIIFKLLSAADQAHYFFQKVPKTKIYWNYYVLMIFFLKVLSMHARTYWAWSWNHYSWWGHNFFQKNTQTSTFSLCNTHTILYVPISLWNLVCQPKIKL